MFLSRKDKNKEQHAGNGNRVVAKSGRSYLSRRARNQLKHAENGNPRPSKTSMEWEAEFDALETWVHKENRWPQQKSKDNVE